MNTQQLVLALNAGSSSIKVSLLNVVESKDHTNELGKQLIQHHHILHALGERLGTIHATLCLDFKIHDDSKSLETDCEASSRSVAVPYMDHSKALELIIIALEDKGLLKDIVAIGHRVVHGGTNYNVPILVDEESLIGIDSISHLAPLHNPSNVMGMRLVQEKLPGIPNVAVFDTSFHSTIPEKAFTYPLPVEYRQMQMRKFGFHGTSVQYVVEHAKSILDSSKHATSREVKAESLKTPYNFVVCHLGSGASVTAVVDDESRDTSMGFTPLAGLMMGTRCGSVDPSLVGYACHVLNKSVDDVMDDWNKRSGLRGMIPEGQDYDMRSLLSRESTDAQAKLAVEMFIYRLAQHIAAAMVALDGPMDALIFTAGIGEHSAVIRRRTLQALQGTILPNAKIDEERNSKDGLETSGIISVDGSFPMLLDVPTDEEAMIAKEAIRIVNNYTN